LHGPQAPGRREVRVNVIDAVEQRRLHAGQIRASRDALAQGFHANPKQIREIAQFPFHADQQQHICRRL
jgi:hypothetical protein